MIRNERAQSVYNYSIFHITLCLANMYAAHSVVSAPGGNNHLLLQVLVHGDPKDGLHLAECAGVLGHTGHPCVETSCTWQHAGGKWVDPCKSLGLGRNSLFADQPHLEKKSLNKFKRKSYRSDPVSLMTISDHQTQKLVLVVTVR